VNNSGNNLFINSSFSLDSLKIYDLENGNTWAPVYFDSTKNIMYLRIYSLFAEKYSKVLIHLKQGIDDTLICHNSGVANEICSSIDSIWYNRVLVTANNKNQAITIV